MARHRFRRRFGSYQPSTKTAKSIYGDMLMLIFAREILSRRLLRRDLHQRSEMLAVALRRVGPLWAAIRSCKQDGSFADQGEDETGARRTCGRNVRVTCSSPTGISDTMTPSTQPAASSKSSRVRQAALGPTRRSAQAYFNSGNSDRLSG